MSHQIIRQPDGRLCAFSTNVNDFVILDATPEELIDYYATQAADDARKRTRRLIAAVLENRARDVYYQFAMTYDEAVAYIAGYPPPDEGDDG